MAVRRVHVKTLIYALARLGLETEYVDMGHSPEHGLIIVPSNFNPEKQPDKAEGKEIKIDLKIDPNIDIDSLLG